ncbi:MAG: flagellar hook basal-body protein [Candidatus Calescibacterium sp.]|nr:flagellar hook basal-body protein [Candidatus Calescibacterium sp.]MCX7972173.1 flagellar hook basal-body protein [bacterium]MDW8194863.1 flagellar hook basal-body protein [Candidatus Calescibacterium sp.]
MFDFYSQMNAINSTYEMINNQFKNLQKFNTIGYKAEIKTFSEIYNDNMATGAVKTESKTLFTQGNVKKTGGKNHMAIEGNGLFIVSDGEKTYYTRRGDFEVKDGKLVCPEGNLVVKAFAVDESGKPRNDKLVDVKLEIDKNGLILGKYNDYVIEDNGVISGIIRYTDPISGQTITKKEPIYKIALANFSDPSTLIRKSDTVFAADEKQKPIIGEAGVGAMGNIKAQHLEMSNIDIPTQVQQAMLAQMQYNATMASFRALNDMVKNASQLVR